MFKNKPIPLEQLLQYIEALIFAADQPISLDDIQSSISDYLEIKVKEEDIEKAITALSEKYQSSDFAIEVVAISEGYQFMTKGAYHKVIGAYLRNSNKKKLTRSAMETLSIIAYRQPVTKSEMEEIRGVNCDYTVQKLLEKNLVEIVGRGDGPGKPLMYGTSAKFMDYFGLKSIADLPKIKEVRPEVNEMGTLPNISEFQPNEEE